MRGKVVIVTGGTEGIGAACVRALAARGCRVALAGLLPSPEPLPEGVLGVYGDLRLPEVRQRLVHQTLERFGRIDGLINNAGVGLYAPASGTAVSDAQSMFEVNLWAPLHLVELARPYLRQAGEGFIVNVGSVGGWVTLPWATMYCASKYAMHALSEGLYRELRGEGIHVMLTVPGIVQTNFRDNVLSGTPPPRVEQIRYVISPNDLAQAIVEGIVRRRRIVVLPKIARLFAFLNYAFPWLMDWYCEYKLGGQGHRASVAQPR